jgi:hypothetical protein
MNFIESGIPNLRFSIMSAKLTCAFCTQTSASFSVKVGSLCGWVDVHFPCEGHIKVRIRGALPDDYLEASKLQQFVLDLLCHLKIQKDETYEATFFKPTKVIEMGKSVNREGLTDRIEIKRKFVPPD